MTAKLIPIEKNRNEMRPQNLVSNKKISAPKERPPGVALSVTFVNATTRGIYRVGDGDIVSILRPGALDAKQCPSRGMI